MRLLIIDRKYCFSFDYWCCSDGIQNGWGIETFGKISFDFTNFKFIDAISLVLFPMVAYQSKFEILSNTFLKVLRMERQLLIINVITLIISVILTIISVFFLHNLTMTVFTIIIVMAIRSTIAELYLKSNLDIKFSIEMLIETVMVVAFISLAWYLPVFKALIGYTIILILYLIIKKKDILRSVRVIKKI